MSDDTINTDDLAPVLDLGPLLLRKRAAQCDHANADVHDAEQMLVCQDCGAEVDVWWWLRRLADEFEEERAELVDLRKRYAAWRADITRRAEQLRQEIVDLQELRAQLRGEEIDGVTLGARLGVRRRRRRKVVTDVSG